MNRLSKIYSSGVCGLKVTEGDHIRIQETPHNTFRLADQYRVNEGDEQSTILVLNLNNLH
jgi:hypothetical protein